MCVSYSKKRIQSSIGQILYIFKLNTSFFSMPHLRYKEKYYKVILWSIISFRKIITHYLGIDYST